MRVKHLVDGSEPARGSRCAAREHAPRPAPGDGGRWDLRADLDGAAFAYLKEESDAPLQVLNLADSGI